MPVRTMNRLQFTRYNVESINPYLRGVYGLLKTPLWEGDVWIYVGKGNIRQRLLDHLNGDNPFISREQPTYFEYEVTLGDPSAREKQLILELAPVCNRRVG